MRHRNQHRVNVFSYVENGDNAGDGKNAEDLEEDGSGGEGTSSEEEDKEGDVRM